VDGTEGDSRRRELKKKKKKKTRCDYRPDGKSVKGLICRGRSAGEEGKEGKLRDVIIDPITDALSTKEKILKKGGKF